MDREKIEQMMQRGAQCMRDVDPEVMHWAAALGGGWLALQGLRRGRFLGGVLATIGGGLLMHGLSHLCACETSAHGIGSDRPDPTIDPVDEAGWESFPSSDPPSFTPSSAG